MTSRKSLTIFYNFAKMKVILKIQFADNQGFKLTFYFVCPEHIPKQP